MTITDNGLYLTLVNGTQTNDIFKSLIQNVVTNGDYVWVVYRYANDKTNMHCTTDTDTNANVIAIDYNDVTAPTVASGVELRTWILDATSSGIPTPSSIGIETNAAVGTSAEQLTAADTPCTRMVITANDANTGRITVGDSTVTDGNGIILYASDSIEVLLNNVNKIYVISSVDGEDVSATYFN